MFNVQVTEQARSSIEARMKEAEEQHSRLQEKLVEAEKEKQDLQEQKQRAWIALLAYALYAVTVFALMPSNPDPVRVPAKLLWTFRAVSLSALIVFWVILGGTFPRLLGRRGLPPPGKASGA